MSRVITGLTSAAQPVTQGYKQGSGYYARWSTDYTTEAEAVAAANALGADINGWNGYSWEISPLSGGCYRLSYSQEQTAASAGGGAGSTTPLSEVWELTPNTVEKDFLEADLSAINALDANEIKLIRKAGEDVDYDYLTDATYLAAGGSQGDIALSIKMMRAGIKSIAVFQPILRKTLTCANNYSAQYSLTGCGEVFTTASIYANESVPATLLFNLPTNSNPTRTDGITKAYGWFKSYPSITQVGNGRWQIVQEWQYGLWATALYTVN